MKALAQPKVKVGNPFLVRYIRDIARIGIWRLLIFHYILVLVLGLGFWPLVTSGTTPHPEVIMKLLGVYCFLIAAIAVPLVSPVMFPRFVESDPAVDSLPVNPVLESDARMVATITLSALAALPMLPILLASDPLGGMPMDPFDSCPYFLTIASAAWVNLLMEMTSPKWDQSGRLARRLAVVGIFILLHVLLVGIFAQMSRVTIQEIEILKFIIDINPFSQLFITMEGENEERLLFGFHKMTDPRFHLLILQLIVLTPVWGIYRILKQDRSRLITTD